MSGANAVGAALGLGADSLGIAVAEMAAMSERRVDRLVNPLVSGLPAFLAADEGAGSGFMIAQYTAVSLVAENRRLAAPASLDGGSHFGAAGGSSQPCDSGRAQAAQDHRQRRDHRRHRIAGGGAGLRTAARLRGPRAANRRRVSQGARPDPALSGRSPAWAPTSKRPELRRRCARESPAATPLTSSAHSCASALDAAAAVDGDDLTGDIGRISAPGTGRCARCPAACRGA